MTAIVIHPVHLAGLSGRLLRAEARDASGREILLVYGLHASLERIADLAGSLAAYGTVACPDLPGFGGMQPLARLGDSPSQSLGEALSKVVETIYTGGERFTIVAVSFGVAIARQMLDRRRDLSERCDLLVSLAGVCSGDQLRVSRSARRALRGIARAAARPVPAAVVRTTLLRPRFIMTAHRRAVRDGTVERLALEVQLWQRTDWRTRMECMAELLSGCASDDRTQSVRVHHVFPPWDRYVRHERVVDALRRSHPAVTVSAASGCRHVPEALSGPSAWDRFLGDAVRRLLEQPAGQTA